MEEWETLQIFFYSLSNNMANDQLQLPSFFDPFLEEQATIKTAKDSGKKEPQRLYFKDKRALIQMLDRLKMGSRQHLHVIADFDNTLTKYWDSERKMRNMSSHGIFRNVDITSEEFKAEEQVS